jgi:hypothetical protein
MAWTVEFAPAFDSEFDALSFSVQDELLAQAKLLETLGPALGRPRVDTLKGSCHANMKELRFQADNGVWRVAFAFDPQRKAIVLVAGDKSGISARRFYAGADQEGRREVRRTFGPAETRKEVTMTTLTERIGKLPKSRRKKVLERAKELIIEEMSLQDLRKARKKTQVHVARELGIKQENVSRIEKRSDLLISTLSGYVEAMGGKLSLVAEFPDRPPITLTGIAALDKEARPAKP